MPPELDNQDPDLDAQAMGAEEPAMDEPDMDEPDMDVPADNSVIGLHGDESDREGAMAKADLFKLANYSHKLYQQLNDDDQMESWVQAKITKAADYIASVYHYLEYEMKFSEYGHHLDNSDTLSEGQKKALKARLTEAKMRIRELKTAQAEKIKLAEGVMNGGEHSCDACGGTGVVHKPGVQPSDRAKKLAAAHNRETRAHYAAHKRLQAEEEGVEEGFGEAEPKEMKVGDTKKTRTGELTKTSTGVVHKNTSYHDDGEAEDKSGKGVKSHAKAQSAAEKKDRAPAQKQSPKSAKTWGMKDGSKFDNRDKMDEAKSKKADKDYDGDGKVESGKDEYLGSRIAAAKKAGKLKEAQKCSECGMFENKCECSLEEAAKPSAGLSKEKKSAVVKKAKAGKDIGKPGKGFDKLAKKAGGGEKGEKIAAAAMWKNIKETTAYLAEKKKKEKMTDENLTVVPNPSGAKDAEEAKKLGAAMPAPAGKKDPISESARLRELSGRLNRAETPMIAESREVDQIRALTRKLLG
jgi:hypothetical protein